MLRLQPAGRVTSAAALENRCRHDTQAVLCVPFMVSSTTVVLCKLSCACMCCTRRPVQRKVSPLCYSRIRSAMPPALLRAADSLSDT